MRYQLGFKCTCWGEISEWSSVKQMNISYQEYLLLLQTIVYVILLFFSVNKELLKHFQAAK